MIAHKTNHAARAAGRDAGRFLLRAAAGFFALCLWAAAPAVAQDTYTDSWGTDRDGEEGIYASVDGAGVTDSGYGGSGTYRTDTTFRTTDGRLLFNRSFGTSTGATTFVSDLMNVDAVREGNYDIESDHWYYANSTKTSMEYVGSSSFLGAVDTVSQSYEHTGQCITGQRLYTAWCFSTKCSLPNSRCLSYSTPYAVLRGLRVSVRFPFFTVRACVTKIAGSTWLPPCR